MTKSLREKANTSLFSRLKIKKEDAHKCKPARHKNNHLVLIHLPKIQLYIEKQ